jgi:hypothetical protein
MDWEEGKNKLSYGREREGKRVWVCEVKNENELREEEEEHVLLFCTEIKPTLYSNCSIFCYETDPLLLLANCIFQFPNQFTLPTIDTPRIE